MRRKVLARSVRSVVEKLEGRTLLSATLAANAGTATISGTVYNDVNGNGVQDIGEPVVAGTTVTLSEVGVVYAPGTVPTVQADINGTFSFTTLAPGQYTVALVPDTGFLQDAPGTFSVSVTSNDSVSIVVGETTNAAGGGSGTAIITGTVFNDVNQDGIYTPTVEDFLAGDTVYLDLNGSGVQTPADPIAITNNTGQYEFDNVAPGSYIVRVVPRTGFHQDPPGFFQITAYSDQTLGQNIGENNRATISGVVFQDLNGDGIQQPGELPVSGEEVYLDLNQDGFPEEGMYNPSTGLWDTDPRTGGNEPFAITDSTGHYSFTGLVPGTYRVSVLSNAGLVEATPGYIDVILAPAQNLSLNIPEAVGSTISGTVYDDRNANGTMDAGESGISNQTVFLDINNNGVFDQAGVGTDGLPLDGPEPMTTTDGNGLFSFTDVGPGTYTLRFVTPPGGVATGPSNATHSYTFTVGNNSVITGQNFGFETPDLTSTIINFPTKPTLTNVQKHALVRVTNVGSLPAIGLAGIDLWAQTTNARVDVSSAFLIANFRGRPIHLNPGQSRVFNVQFAYPTLLPLNSYFVTSQVVSTLDDNNVTNDFSSPVGPVKVGPPYIDLGLTYPGQPPLIVNAGQGTSLDLVLTNTGNVTNKGTVSFRVYLSLQPVVEPTDVVAETVTVANLHLAPGKSRNVHLFLPFPQQNLGFQYINVLAVTGDPLGETNLLNNTAIEPMATRFD